MTSPPSPRPDPLALLGRLVAFNTESGLSNLGVIGFIRDYLAQWGVASLVIPDATGEKAALFATIGPGDRGGVLLSGHTDVVPVEGQEWTGDPFRLRVENGRAYGRGAVDMKGFIALCLAAVPDMLAAGLKTPIHLFFSYDEETTCLGVVDGIRRFGVDLPRPQAVIVGEPTDLEVADAHKSVVTFHTHVTGHEAHSAKPHLGASAVHAAALLVAELVRLDEEMAAKGDASGRFDPPRTTVHVGTISGGTARNILAKSCQFHWEFRGLPDQDENAIPQALEHFAQTRVLPAMRRSAPLAQVETSRDVAVPGLAPEPGSAAERLALRLAERNHTITVPYGTEAGHFQRAGIPTVVCGPGSIDQAHQPDEYITLEALEAGRRFIARLIAHCAAR